MLKSFEKVWRQYMERAGERKRIKGNFLALKKQDAIVDKIVLPIHSQVIFLVWGLPFWESASRIVHPLLVEARCEIYVWATINQRQRSSTQCRSDSGRNIQVTLINLGPRLHLRQGCAFFSLTFFNLNYSPMLQSNHLFKKGPFQASFSLFSSFQQLAVNRFINYFCWWLDSNWRPLVLEAIALPTEPQQCWDSNPG